MHQISVLFPEEVDEDSFEAGCVIEGLESKSTIDMDAIIISTALHTVTP